MPANALAEKIIFATSEWPPYLIAKNGQATGIHTEIIFELCKRLKIALEIQVLPWKRALMYAEKGKVDAVFSARHTEEREKFLYYSAEPIQIERTVILTLKGSNLKVTEVDDLKGKVLGVVRGYAYGPKFDNYQGIGKEVCDDDEQLIRLLAKKRISLAVGADEDSLKYVCKKLGVEAQVVYALNEIPSYIAFSKKAMGEKGKTLAEKFSEVLRQLKKEGFIKKTQSKYF